MDNACLIQESVIKALTDVLGVPISPLALHEPSFEGEEFNYVKDCLDSGWVSSVGQYVPKLEEKIALACGARHAVATVNGTAAIHLALLVAGVKPQDEVLMPALTFVATANAVSYCNAVPHFVDSDPSTLGIHPQKLRETLRSIVSPSPEGPRNGTTGRRLAAIVPVHIFGHPVDMDPLLELAETYGIPVVEDAAESLGSLYKGRKTGSIGRLGGVSFNGNKIVTTGGGGAVVTNDADLAERVRHLATTAKCPHQWSFNHDAIGYNYRLPNLNAALGCAQMERLETFLQAKRALAGEYEKSFREMADVHFLTEPPFATSNYWLNAILLKKSDIDCRDALLRRLHKAGFLCRPVWTLMHHLPMYRDCPRMDLTVAEDIAGRIINLPSSAKLGARYVS